MQVPTHLGGHNNITHLDPGALEWAINSFGIGSFLDIGCGPGGMVELAESYGLESMGIDGDFSVQRSDNKKFIIHDFTQGPVRFNKTFDLGWSVEFVEHVYERYIPNYVQSFLKCKYLIMTYAPPGWPGHHHVNCKEESYWIHQLQKWGFRHDRKQSKRLRSSSNMYFIKGKKKKSRSYFVEERGMFFINERF